jgi:hypothetical protein
MPGKEITIADKTWKLKPLAGLQSFKMVPKIISIATELIWSAQESGFSIEQFFKEEGQTKLEKMPITTALSVFHFVANTMDKRYTELTVEVIPFLLQKEWQWLNENGTPKEILQALWTAITYHVETSFGKDVIEALKNSVIVEEGSEENQTHSTSPEASP